jgi:hypothetical protein
MLYQPFQHPRRPRWRMSSPATCLPRPSAPLIPFGGGWRMRPLILISLGRLVTTFVSQVSFVLCLWTYFDQFAQQHLLMSSAHLVRADYFYPISETECPPNPRVPCFALITGASRVSSSKRTSQKLLTYLKWIVRLEMRILEPSCSNFCCITSTFCIFPVQVCARVTQTRGTCLHPFP